METDQINKLKAGNEKAFHELVEMYKDNVLNTCYHYIHNRMDAEDLAQEVFIEVHRSIHHFKEDAQLSTWIYRIAVNKSLDLIRKRKRKKRFGYLVSIFTPEDDERDVQLPDSGDPETSLEQKERMQILYSAIENLAENQKTALTLSKFEGLSNKEIADIMNTSVSSVESLLHRARSNLRQKLHNYFKDFY